MDTPRRTPLSIPSIFKRSIHFCYLSFIEPHSLDRNKKRQELILNIILVSFLLLLVCLDLVILHNSIASDYLHLGIPFILFTSFIFLFSGLYFLSRKGKSKLASYILVGLFSFGAFYGSARWGIGMPMGLLSYGLIISMASILISTRFGVITTAIVVAFISIVGAIQSETNTLPYWRFEPIKVSDGIQYSVMLLLTMTISWLANREIEKSLERATLSEQALMEKNDSLETLVAERTKELRRIQAEKVSQLYRFAEFGRLSSGIFHDLVNPLSIVTSNMNHLEVSLHPDLPIMKDHLHRAVLASRRMEKFIHTVKKQMRNDEMSELFSINDEIEEVLILFNYKALKEKIAIEFQATEKIFTHGSPSKFQRGVGNLVSNAIDSYDGLNISQDKKFVRVSLIKKENNDVSIIVTDNGCGIPDSVMEKIFDPFFTTKSQHKGMGFGLSTTKDIVEKDFGGSITAHKNNTQGSTFIITFPLKKDAPQFST